MIAYFKWAWFKHKRRSLEAREFCMHQYGPWRKTCEENDELGIWK